MQQKIIKNKIFLNIIYIKLISKIGKSKAITIKPIINPIIKIITGSKRELKILINS